MQIEIFRRMSPRRKLEIMEEANRNAREAALAGLRMRHPDAGPDELFRRLMDLTLGEELAERVYGPLRTDRATRAPESSSSAVGHRPGAVGDPGPRGTR